LYMLATLASAAVMMIVGNYADRFDPAALGAAVCVGLAGAAALAATAPNAAVLALAFFAQRVFGQGLPGPVAMTAMARWYDAERGRAVGVTAMGFPLGEALFPPLAVVVLAITDWRGVWWASAAFAACAVAPVVFILMRRAPPAQQAGEGARPKRAAARSWTRGEVVRDPLFYALAAALTAPPLAITGILFHQARLVEAKGWSLAGFAATYPAFAVGSIGAALGFGWLIDRYGLRGVLRVYTPALALGAALLAGGDALWTAAVGMAGMGLAGGAGMTVMGALWAELYGLGHLGAIRATVVAAMVFSTALAPGAMGFAMDLGIAIETLCFALAAFAVVASAGLIALAPVLARRGVS
ncbi:MAG: MFS transporter, partial [Pseudomonadota bacterium]